MSLVKKMPGRKKNRKRGYLKRITGLRKSFVKFKRLELVTGSGQ